MRLSRPCYDKPHRCPGWAGGGTRYAKANRCTCGGSMPGFYDRRAWRWRPYRNAACGVLVLPYVVRWLDLRYWPWKIQDVRWKIRDWREDRRA